MHSLYTMHIYINVLASATRSHVLTPCDSRFYFIRCTFNGAIQSNAYHNIDMYTDTHRCMCV